jgi:ribose transport system substrate-binding protein
MRPVRLTTTLVAALFVVGACSGGSTLTPPPAATAGPTAAPETAAPSATPAAGGLAGKKVAFVLWGYDAYQQGQGEWFKKTAEADGVEVTLIDGKTDPLAQAKAIDDLIAGGYDGIAWQPVDPGAAVEASKKVQAAGIPLVWVGGGPNKSTGVVAPQAIFNDYEVTKQAGAMAAKWVVDTLKQTPKVVLFDILSVPICHDIRMTGFMDGVKSVAPDAETVFWDTVPASKDGTLAKMEDQLQANPDFNIFTGCGGDLILGGIAGLEAAGRGKAVDKNPVTEWILSIDGTPDEITRLLNPESSVEATITLTPKENGQKSWALLKEVMLGEIAPTSDKVVDLPGKILPTDCEELKKIYDDQYSITQAYQPIDCSKY